MVIVRSHHALEVWLGQCMHQKEILWLEALKRIAPTPQIQRGSCAFPKETQLEPILLLFLMFSLARPNKKELLQKESFLSGPFLCFCCFSWRFPPPGPTRKNYPKKKEAPPYHYQGLWDPPPPQLVIGFPITNLDLLTPPPIG